MPWSCHPNQTCWFLGELSPKQAPSPITSRIQKAKLAVIDVRGYKQLTNLSTVNTRAILPIARILLRITSFLLIASLCSSSSSPSSSSSVQILRIFTSISVTKSKKVKNMLWTGESNSCWFLELGHLEKSTNWTFRTKVDNNLFINRTIMLKHQTDNKYYPYIKFSHPLEI